MKTRIEEAFFSWFREQDPERFYSKELAARDGFIAGAEFMQKEVDLVKHQLDYAEKILTEVQADKFVLSEMLRATENGYNTLKAQNEIMRESLDKIIKDDWNMTTYSGNVARKALKKIGEV
jgi:hypothetical protein